MSTIYKLEGLTINREEGYFIPKGQTQKIPASKEVLNEILRTYWRSDKQQQKSKYRTLSYNKRINKNTEFLDILAGPSRLEPEKMLARKHLHEALYDAIDSISGRTKEVGTLYFIEGLTEEAIAEKLGITHQAVNYRKKSFQKLLKKNRELAECYAELER